MTCTFLNARVSGYLDLKFGRLKVHVINQRKVLHWWGKPYKNFKEYSMYESKYIMPHDIIDGCYTVELKDVVWMHYVY